MHLTRELLACIGGLLLIVATLGLLTGGISVGVVVGGLTGWALIVWTMRR